MGCLLDNFIVQTLNFLAVITAVTKENALVPARETVFPMVQPPRS